MKNLVIPDKNKHRFVIGIDFGHGETSAAFCRLEWDANPEKRIPTATDLALDQVRNLVIPSAICKDSQGEYHIGQNAFDAQYLKDLKKESLAVCFKKAPQDIDGKEEKLMIEFMRTVYNNILRNNAELTEDNHVVYIARPSGWNDSQTKDLYKRMALEADIPLVNLTSESRAAFFYAKQDAQAKFTKLIDKGAIVFDLGSSTLDFTFLTKNEKAIDFGYNLGASIIENTIYEKKILANEDMIKFIDKYPFANAAILYEARKIKEEAYSKEKEATTFKNIDTDNIMQGESDIEAVCKIKFKGIQELNDFIEEGAHYISELKNAILDFKTKYIPEKEIHGVFLTGGASKMSFVKDIVASSYGQQVYVYLDSNPSNSVSRGIALLGSADIITNEESASLRQESSQILKNLSIVPPFIEDLSKKITSDVCKYIDESLIWWQESNPDMSINDLEVNINHKIDFYTRQELPNVISTCFMNIFNNEFDEVIKKINRIIHIYAPEKEIEYNSHQFLGTQTIDTDFNRSIEGIISECTEIIKKDISNTVGKILWAALGVFLFGLFAVGYYLVKWAFFNGDDEDEDEKKRKNPLSKSKREKAVASIDEKGEEIATKIYTGIYEQLQGNQELIVNIERKCDDFFHECVVKKINESRIDIE
jgi:hypothetical protein